MRNEPKRENTRRKSSLHRFFQTLRTPYRAYQAEAPEDLARAVADVGRQQNFPLDFIEQVPRVGLQPHLRQRSPRSRACCCCSYRA